MLKRTPFVTRKTSDGRCLLNVGCGGRFHAEWNNVDLHSIHPLVVPYDVLRGLPYRDGVFDGVYCSHFLEHLPLETVSGMLREMSRVLRSGGIIRVVVPDLEYHARLYLECLEKVRASGGVLEEEHYDWSVISLIDQMTRETFGGELAGFMIRQDLKDVDFIRTTLGGTDIDEAQTTGQLKGGLAHGMALKPMLIKILKQMVPPAARTLRKRMAYRQSGEAHKWMYDEYSMARVLRKVGFTNTETQDAHKSRIKDFVRYHLDTDARGMVRKPNSLFMEAIK